MKKLTALFIVLGLMFAIKNVYAADRPIKVIVGGRTVLSDCNFTLNNYGNYDKPSIRVELQNDRIFLPLRVIFEEIGAKVEYDGATQKITAKKNGDIVELTIGSNVMLVNNEEKIIDAAPYIKNGKTYIPVRACAEAFGLEVQWDDFTKTVKIKKEVSLYANNCIYDDRGNLIQESSNGMIMKHAYDENNNEIYFENSNGVWWKKEYNEYNELVYMESNEGIKKYVYEDGYKKSLEYQSNNPDYIPSYSVEFFYDSYGNLYYLKYSDGLWNKYQYDELGNVTSYEDSRGYREKFEYNEYGQITKMEQEHGTFYYFYDENARLIQINWGETTVHKTYTYDAMGNLIREADAYNQWKNYEYDNQGNLIKESDHNGTWVVYSYDENGNLIREENSMGRVWKYEYDQNGNLISNSGYMGNSKYIVVVK